MLFKRVHERDGDGKPAVQKDAAGAALQVFDGYDPQTGEKKYRSVYKPEIGVRVLDLGATANQNFSTDLVMNAMQRGWMVMGVDKLIIKAENGDLAYNIRRAPGYYCCHCGVAIEDAGVRRGDGPTVGQKHVADNHPDLPSPDLANPAGYERINHYDCVEAEARSVTLKRLGLEG